ncbi:hypothetical protein KD146_04570 [Devosia sp. BSSL-BM10]|uniref:Heme peroxidase n=1 Tax=Devosia litorisediminis TaxID=2829817 RepID=A0A942E4B6_9HYPH|nr:peroxidase family protein [Devosia litorisediminis]MBS3847968.1 hypothetical protein [Devosia litorisediminis]
MQHGVKNFEVVAPRSRFYQGGFGRMFPDLKPWKPELAAETATALEQHMLDFANAKMTAADNEDTDSTLPAGYTYFGQFVDHDITLDVTPLSDAEVDPNRLHNFRTPRLDLDNVYGLGPDAQPYLYENVAGRIKLRVGSIGNRFRDLARLSRAEGESQTALIGDHRNDENAVVAQVQLAFIMAHNSLADAAFDLGLQGMAGFQAARNTLKWLYQWVVWNDYIARICQAEVHETALRHHPDAVGEAAWEAGYKHVFDWRNTPYMPLEFSVAAYRFGHSLVRDRYQTNVLHGFGSFIPIFAPNGATLMGFRALEADRVVQWDWFLPMTSSSNPFPQMTRKFDPRLAQALTHLPEDPERPGDSAKILNVLAARNLVRGVRMELPAGTAVAKALNVAPISLSDTEPDALWYYVLREAELDGGNCLGKVGSIIVAATFAGLLKGDPLSYFNIEPGWTPAKDTLLKSLQKKLSAANKSALNADAHIVPRPVGQPDWTFAAIIRLAGLPVQADDFAQQ